MNITYITNHASTSKSLTEWYFGKQFVNKTIEQLMSSGMKSIKVFQPGTGFLTIKIS